MPPSYHRDVDERTVDDSRRGRPRLCRSAARGRVRQEISDDRLRPLREQVAAYRRHVDPTGEVSSERVQGGDAGCAAPPTRLPCRRRTSSSSRCRRRSTTRTSPDFAPLVGASTAVGRNLKRGATVVFESTVYPGATEEVCIPILEKHSGLQLEAGLLRRLLARAHQPGRQGAHADDDHQGRLRRHARDARARGADVRQHRQGRRLQGARASRSPRPRRSSRTRSATSTSR